jgi:CBS domain-containing protein
MTAVSDVMTRGVRSLTPDVSMMKAAQAMDELNVGAMPVCDGERLVGMVTDRDIVVRGVAQGSPADQTPVSAVMSSEARWCFEDDAVQDASGKMRQMQIRRMPVVDKERRLVGIVSLGDLATKGETDTAGEALKKISEPSKPDRSSQSQASGPAGGGGPG